MCMLYTLHIYNAYAVCSVDSAAYVVYSAYVVYPVYNTFAVYVYIYTVSTSVPNPYIYIYGGVYLVHLLILTTRVTFLTHAH